MKKIRNQLVMGVSLLAAGYPAQAWAQTSDAETAQKTASENEEGGIADIVVTAQRREENVQRAALSIEAFDADQIARVGVTRPEDLAKIASGVNIGTGGNMPQVYIRGIGTYATNNYADSPIAMNVDGVFVSRPWGMRGAYFDLQRIEVLRGPQGTLYGRNASGGAVNLISNRPKFDDFGGSIELEAGNYKLLSGNAALNIPVSDTLAFRVAGQRISRDGYLSDGTDDQDTTSARLHMLFEPNTDFSLLVTGNFQSTEGRGAGVVPGPDTPLIQNTGDAWIGAGDPRVVAITNSNPTLLQVAPGVFVPHPLAPSRLLQNDESGFIDSRILSISAELNWDLGPATLTFVPAYRDGRQSNRFQITGFNIDEWEENEQTTLELRLANESDRLKWVLGAYYFNEDISNTPGERFRIAGGEISSEEILNLKTNARSYAFFGQATFSVLDNLRLTGGLRYTHERKNQAGESIGYANFLAPIPGVRPPGTCPVGLAPINFQRNEFATFTDCAIRYPLLGKVEDSAVTWKVGVEFEPAERSLIYANVSTGFKSGGLFSAPTVGTNFPTYDPETLTAFELGTKNRFLDNRLQFNVEAFYYDYKDHQENYLSSIPGIGYIGFRTVNAGKAYSYGVQSDLAFQATDNDLINFNLQWNKSKYESFAYTSPSPTGAPPVVGCAVGAPTGNEFPIDCAGFPLVRTPKWSGSVDYLHTFDLKSGSAIDVRGYYRFASSSYLAIDLLEAQKNSSYGVFDADLTFRTSDDKFSITAWIRNIGNEAVYTQAFRAPFILPAPANPQAGPVGLIGMSVAPPRTFGVRANIRF
ncbi:MAG: hypothetical protein RL481_1011 [Pseudomonadota bacterium]|jgi:iron complex outermembrane receptor protein